MPLIPTWESKAHAVRNGYTQTVADIVRLLSSLPDQSLYIVESEIPGNIALFSEKDGYMGYVDLVCGDLDLRELYEEEAREDQRATRNPYIVDGIHFGYCNSCGERTDLATGLCDEGCGDGEVVPFDDDPDPYESKNGRILPHLQERSKAMIDIREIDAELTEILSSLTTRFSSLSADESVPDDKRNIVVVMYLTGQIEAYEHCREMLRTDHHDCV